MGVKEDQLPELVERYGPCQLIVPRKSIPALLVDEVLNPFYLFQVFSVILWFWDGYQKYALCILFISVASVVENLHETVSNINSVRKMASYECDIVVRRGNLHKTIKSGQLVPGDVVVVPDNCLMPCDMVLLTGSCILNESMLTGESIPVIKNCLSPIKEAYDPQQSKKHTLYSGTKVISSREIGNQKVYALVIRTGYVTTKGSLVRDILYPRKTKFRFY
jgi:magnesium-transporting ATPase (P-type)